MSTLATEMFVLEFVCEICIYYCGHDMNRYDASEERVVSYPHSFIGRVVNILINLTEAIPRNTAAYTSLPSRHRNAHPPLDSTKQ